jgi:uncharacterized protein YbaR (Trm112 family)
LSDIRFLERLSGRQDRSAIWRALPIEEDRMAISRDLLDILACPKCKGDIHLNQDSDGLVCEACRLMYPIKDDIPIMLIDEAIQL